MRRVATGTGVLALAVPMAWPSGAHGQHLDVPSASSVRSEVARLADWVSGDTSTPPALPRQQTGAAAVGTHPVSAASTKSLKHVTGRAPGKGKGELPAWAPRTPLGSKPYLSGSAQHGFNPATSSRQQAGTTAQSVVYKNADGSYTRDVWSQPVNYETTSGSWAAIDPTLVAGTGGRWQEKANSLAVSFAGSGSDSSLASVANPGGTQQVSFALAGAGNVAASESGERRLDVIELGHVAQVLGVTTRTVLERLDDPGGL